MIDQESATFCLGPDLPKLVKIESNQQCQPLLLRIKYHTKGDLAIYVSFRDKLPSEKSYDLAA